MDLQLSNLEGKTFEEKIEMWAKEVVEYCHPIACDTNMAFYAFQSNPQEEPEVLLLGLNPGGGGKYNRKMEVENFTQGNNTNWYNENWRIVQNLKKTIKVTSELENFLTNDKNMVSENCSSHLQKPSFCFL